MANNPSRVCQGKLGVGLPDSELTWSPQSNICESTWRRGTCLRTREEVCIEASTCTAKAPGELWLRVDLKWDWLVGLGRFASRCDSWQPFVGVACLPKMLRARGSPGNLKRQARA